MTRKATQRIRIFLLLAAALSMGMHYAVVQVVGWVNMTLDNSQQAPFSEALSMTFDGKHPCELCKLVEKELGKTDPNDGRTPGKKAEFKLPPVICWADGIRLARPFYQFFDVANADLRTSSKRERPPLPPPREVMIHIS